MEEFQSGPAPKPGFDARRAGRIVWLVIEHLFDLAVDGLIDYARIIWREIELFAGVGLIALSLLNFENGKNCDGNTADYLSCTNPSTFYYYNWLEIGAVVIGVFLLLLWYFKRKERSDMRG